MYVDELLDFILSHRREIEEAITEKRREMETQKGHTGGAPSSHAFIPDPTANRAIKAASALPYVYVDYQDYAGNALVKTVRNPETWLLVEDEVYKHFFTSEQMREFYLRRYKRGERWGKTCKDLNIGRAVYYAMRDNVNQVAEDIAIGYGALSPYCRISEKKNS